MKGRQKFVFSTPAPVKGVPEKPKEPFVFKINVSGDRVCGTSSLILRFTEDVFTESYPVILGNDSKTRKVEIKQEEARLIICERKEEEIFRAYSAAHVAIVVFDLTDRSSFDSLTGILQATKKFSSDNTPIILVGNKSDLVSKRVITDDEIKEFVLSFGETIHAYISCSAKNSDNVDLVFLTAAELALDRVKGVLSSPLQIADSKLDGDIKLKLQKLLASSNAKTVKSQHKIAVLNKTLAYLEGSQSIQNLRECMNAHPLWAESLGSSIFASASEVRRL